VVTDNNQCAKAHALSTGYNTGNAFYFNDLLVEFTFGLFSAGITSASSRTSSSARITACKISFWGMFTD
jgi:hypothetical protein